MNLNIVELSNPLKNVRRAQRDGAIVRTPGGTTPALCGCSNRYGVVPAIGEGNGEQRVARSRGGAAFAALGR